jgi:hypothetical protein
MSHQPGIVAVEQCDTSIGVVAMAAGGCFNSCANDAVTSPRVVKGA